MGVKRGNLKLISGLLLPSFILNYMLIRVKERGFFNKKNRKNKERERERSREEGNEEETKLGKLVALLRIFGGGRLWFMLFVVSS